MDITYTPKGPIIKDKSGPFLTTRLMWRELVSSKELIWRLFLRDFEAKYRQSLFGVSWSILTPLVVVGLFVALNRAGILTVEGVDVPYPLYALIGLAIWNLFSVGLTACSNALVRAGSMVVKINFPKVALIFAASGQSVIEFSIRMGLIALAFIYFDVTPAWKGFFFGLLLLVPIYMMAVGIGFALSLVGVVIRDIVNVLNIALMGMMLLTPILYPITGDNLLASINQGNPFNYLVNVPRDFMVKGHSEFFADFIWAAVLSAVVCYLGWRFFYLAQNKIAERL